MHIWIYEDWESTHKTRTNSSQARDQLREGGTGHRVPPLVKKLFARDSFWKRESQFSLMAWHWVYQPHSRRRPVPRSSWPPQNRPNVFVCFLLFHFVLLLAVLFHWCFVSIFIFVFLLFCTYLFWIIWGKNIKWDM